MTRYTVSYIVSALYGALCIKPQSYLSTRSFRQICKMRVFTSRVCAFACLLGLAEGIIIRPGGSADELGNAAIQDSRLTARFSRIYANAGGSQGYGTFTDGPNGLSGVILSTGKVQDAPAGYQCPRVSALEARVQTQCAPSTAFESRNFRCSDYIYFSTYFAFPEGISEVRVTLIFATGEESVSTRPNSPFSTNSEQVGLRSRRHSRIRVVWAKWQLFRDKFSIPGRFDQRRRPRSFVFASPHQNYCFPLIIPGPNRQTPPSSKHRQPIYQPL